MTIPALLILGVFLAVLFWNRALHIRVVERTLALDRELAERKKAEKELQQALARVRTLKGLVPICSSCKKIRDDQGFWNQIEQYIEKHSDAMFSHGICPECMEKLYGDEGWYKQIKKKNQLP